MQNITGKFPGSGYMKDVSFLADFIREWCERCCEVDNSDSGLIDYLVAGWAQDGDIAY